MNKKGTNSNFSFQYQDEVKALIDLLQIHNAIYEMDIPKKMLTIRNGALNIWEILLKVEKEEVRLETLFKVEVRGNLNQLEDMENVKSKSYLNSLFDLQLDVNKVYDFFVRKGLIAFNYLVFDVDWDLIKDDIPKSQRDIILNYDVNLSTTKVSGIYQWDFKEKENQRRELLKIWFKIYELSIDFIIDLKRELDNFLSPFAEKVEGASGLSAVHYLLIEYFIKGSITPMGDKEPFFRQLEKDYKKKAVTFKKVFDRVSTLLDNSSIHAEKDIKYLIIRLNDILVREEYKSLWPKIQQFKKNRKLN